MGNRRGAGRRGILTRRAFLGGSAGAGAASLLGPRAAPAEPQAGQGIVAPPPSAGQIERDTGASRPPATPGVAVRRPGSDLIVQVLRDLGVEYVAANPASSFEGLIESIVNTGDPPNTMPELITALHEESAVDMAHGYAKAEGRPMAVMLHGTIGLLHASMAIYQAFHARAPVVILVGRDNDFIRREQSADDIAGLARAYTKWDAQPTTLEEALAAIRTAWNRAMTPPRGPALVVLDTGIQKQEAGSLGLPAGIPLVVPTITAAEARTIGQALSAADSPRLQVGRLRTPAGVALAVELAELVGAAVQTAATHGPMSYPQSHRLCGPGADANYDYTLGLETYDYTLGINFRGADAAIVGPTMRTVTAERDTTNIGFGFLRDRPPPPPLARSAANDVAGDAEASLPMIIAEVRRLRSRSQAAAAAARARRHAEANHAHRVRELERALEARRTGWNGSPVSLARIYAELWPLIENEDWCLSSPSRFSGMHHVALWSHDRPHSYLGTHGAGGIGYCIGASAGAALAARGRGRIVINVQGDGDLNYAPGSLWTAAHHHLPLLTIVHNNRGYHQEVMYLHHTAGVRGRGTDRMHIGTTLRDPYIDYASMAAAYGMESEGPVEDPAALRPAYERGLAAVKAGRPYLIDVISQPR